MSDNAGCPSIGHSLYQMLDMRMRYSLGGPSAWQLYVLNGEQRECI